MLPRFRQRKQAAQPSVRGLVCVHSIEIDAPIDVVWQISTNVANLPAILSQTTRVEPVAPSTTWEDLNPIRAGAKYRQYLYHPRRGFRHVFEFNVTIVGSVDDLQQQQQQGRKDDTSIVSDAHGVTSFRRLYQENNLDQPRRASIDDSDISPVCTTSPRRCTSCRENERVASTTTMDPPSIDRRCFKGAAQHRGGDFTASQTLERVSDQVTRLHVTCALIPSSLKGRFLCLFLKYLILAEGNYSARHNCWDMKIAAEALYRDQQTQTTETDEIAGNSDEPGSASGQLPARNL